MTLSFEEQLDWLVRNGFANDLREVLLGESKCSDMREFDRLDRFSHRLRGMTLDHLQFVASFGFEKVGEPVKIGKQTHMAYPEYFEAWKLAGAPGVSPVLIDGLFKAKTASRTKTAGRSLG